MTRTTYPMEALTRELMVWLDNEHALASAAGRLKDQTIGEESERQLRALGYID